MPHCADKSLKFRLVNHLSSPPRSGGPGTSWLEWAAVTEPLGSRLPAYNPILHTQQHALLVVPAKTAPGLCRLGTIASKTRG